MPARIGPLSWTALLLAACAGTRPEPADPGGPPARTQPVTTDEGSFQVLARLHPGRAPHQIAFTVDGATALVAAAGSDHVALIDVAARRVRATLPVEGTPIGVAAAGDLVLASRFSGRTVAVLADAGPGAELAVGPGPSMLVGPLAGGRLLVSSERARELAILEVRGTPRVIARIPVGGRPYPPAVSPDGTWAFVPNYDDGTITPVDLSTGRVLPSLSVGSRPSGCAVLPDGKALAVVLRGEDRIAWIDLERPGAGRVLMAELQLKSGTGPSAVLYDRVTGLGFVSTAASDVLVLAPLASGIVPQVLKRIAVSPVPVAMAIHERRRELWIACEGSHEVVVLRLPTGPGR